MKRYYSLLFTVIVSLAALAQPTPTAYYPLDADLNDASGNNYHATDEGTTAVEFIKDDVRGRVAHFAVDAHAFLPYTADLSIGTGDFSIAFWVKIPNDPIPTDDPVIFTNKDWDSGGNPGLLIALDDADVPVASHMLTVNFADIESGERLDWDADDNFASNIADNVWHHMVVTLDRDATMKVYLDNVLYQNDPDLSSRDMTICPGNADDPIYQYGWAMFQSSTGTYGHDMEGWMDEVYLFKGEVLTPEEIGSLFQAPNIPDSCQIYYHYFNKTDISCNDSTDGTIDLTVNDPGFYKYQWSTGDTTEDISNLTSGLYKVSVTDTIGCTISDSIAIIEPDPLILSFIDSISPSYYGFGDGQARISVDGGTVPYGYIWDNPGNSVTPVVSDLFSSKVYHVTVTDSRSCIATDSIIFADSKTLFTTISIINNVSCNGYSDGSAIVSPFYGILPYSYSWDDDSTSTDSIATSLTAGIAYHVSVTDAIGNTGENSIVLTEPSPPDYSVALTVDKQLLTAPPFAFQFNNYTPKMLNYIFIWDFGDDTTIINNNPTVFHEYDYNGTYDITLYAEHKETGCMDSIFLQEYIYCTGGEDPSSTSPNEVQNNEILIFPNPFTESTTIAFPNQSNEQYRLVLTDLSGKECRMVDNIATSDYVLQKGDLNEGLYFIEFRGPKIFRGKILIE